jgi:hypothetical protein
MSMDIGVSPQEPRRTPATSQMMVGFLIIAVGLLFTLDNLGIAHARDILRYWPAGLMAIGLVKLWDSRDGRGGGFGGLMITIVGLWLLLVSLGVYLVWRGLTGHRRTAIGGDDRSMVSAVAILSGVNRGNNSRTFRGGDLTAVMGGCEIDLRQAAINGDAVLDVFAMWGGIEIRVPEDWTVTFHVTPIMGGIEDKTRPGPGSTTHRLTIRGLVLMGGIEVKN